MEDILHTNIHIENEISSLEEFKIVSFSINFLKTTGFSVVSGLTAGDCPKELIHYRTALVSCEPKFPLVKPPKWNQCESPPTVRATKVTTGHSNSTTNCATLKHPLTEASNEAFSSNALNKGLELKAILGLPTTLIQSNSQSQPNNVNEKPSQHQDCDAENRSITQGAAGVIGDAHGIQTGVSNSIRSFSGSTNEGRYTSTDNNSQSLAQGKSGKVDLEGTVCFNRTTVRSHSKAGAIPVPLTARNQRIPYNQLNQISDSPQVRSQNHQSRTALGSSQQQQSQHQQFIVQKDAPRSKAEKDQREIFERERQAILKGRERESVQKGMSKPLSTVPKPFQYHDECDALMAELMSENQGTSLQTQVQNELEMSPEAAPSPRDLGGGLLGGALGPLSTPDPRGVYTAGEFSLCRLERSISSGSGKSLTAAAVMKQVVSQEQLVSGADDRRNRAANETRHYLESLDLTSLIRTPSPGRTSTSSPLLGLLSGRDDNHNSSVILGGLFSGGALASVKGIGSTSDRLGAIDTNSSGASVANPWGVPGSDVGSTSVGLWGKQVLPLSKSDSSLLTNQHDYRVPHNNSILSSFGRPNSVGLDIDFLSPPLSMPSLNEPTIMGPLPLMLLPDFEDDGRLIDTILTSIELDDESLDVLIHDKLPTNTTIHGISCEGDYLGLSTAPLDETSQAFHNSFVSPSISIPFPTTSEISSTTAAGNPNNEQNQSQVQRKNKLDVKTLFSMASSSSNALFGGASKMHISDNTTHHKQGQFNFNEHLNNHTQFAFHPNKYDGGQSSSTCNNTISQSNNTNAATSRQSRSGNIPGRGVAKMSATARLQLQRLNRTTAGATPVTIATTTVSATSTVQNSRLKKIDLNSFFMTRETTEPT